ncbi:DnaT-like ssDNA-binding domain-containing protein [uncultured Succinivibrio sp.]|uniref:DnaT-like ssDNA-binding domain-containing protein n=1 Tax=uncultured Succinivibrio sp. TaxID=540749 RepID=UPI0025DA7134|nr:DnaT-like ssDNA-binding domain-containing protein [uncultured Succinivibrio sp.]
MNATELNYLKSSQLSHIAKSLYAFYLRDLAAQDQCIIDLTAIANYLPNYQIASMCLDELEKAGLLRKLSETSNWQGCVFELPLYVREQQEVPKAPFVMTTKWEPGPTFHKTAILCGLEDSTYTLTDLNSFRHYWCSKNESRNQVGWERAFAQRLLKARQQRTEVRFNTEPHNALDIPQNQISKPDTPRPEEIEKLQQQTMEDFQNLFGK